MANNFINNLRASRANSRNNISHKLPERKDIQKQDKQDAKIPLSLDRLSELLKKDTERNLAQDREKNRGAYNGTSFIQYDEYGNPAHFSIDDDVSPFIDIQVAENADRLNAILDKYDKAPTWEEKMNVIKQESKTFPNKNTAINYWFDNIARLTDASMNPKDNYPVNSPESISKAVRHITNSVRNMYFRSA